MNLSVSHFLTSGCNLSLFWPKTQSFLKKISLKIFILFEFLLCTYSLFERLYLFCLFCLSYYSILFCLSVSSFIIRK